MLISWRAWDFKNIVFQSLCSRQQAYFNFQCTRLLFANTKWSALSVMMFEIDWTVLSAGIEQMAGMLMKHSSVGVPTVSAGNILICMASYGTESFMYVLTLGRMKQENQGIGLWQWVHRLWTDWKTQESSESHSFSPQISS